MRHLWSIRASFSSPKVGSEAPTLLDTTVVEAHPDLYTVAEPTLARENDLGGDNSIWYSPAVSAVMLGILGAGAITGANIVHADTVDAPARDPNAIDPAVRDAAAALEGARETMSPEELARARDNLWRAFVNRSPTTATVDLRISSGVGVGLQNRTEDVQVIQNRLHQLGFPSSNNGRVDKTTERGIRIFEAIVQGREGIAGTTGRIQPGSDLHNALASPDAPRWVKIPSSGPGFVNDDTDGYSHGTDRLLAVIQDAAKHYQDGYRATNPDSALMSLNDASRRDGGPNRDHETHELGLDLDIRLPKKDGTSGTNVLWREYDRSATYAMIEAFAQDPRVERVLVSDRTLLRDIGASNVPWKHKVVYGGAEHRNHLHIDVSPPDGLTGVRLPA